METKKLVKTAEEINHILDNAVLSEEGKGLYPDADKDKLESISEGANKNVQADWNEKNETSDSYIRNKPTIPPSIEVDSEMSDTSENPVQNKVVKKYVDDVANVATTPIYEALATIADEVMTRDKDAVEGNVAVFDAEGNAVDSGKSVEDFKGADGEDGVGVPAGGSAGQVLAKKSDADYDTEWVDAPQGGGGGTVDIVDNLTTADPTKALSANMGKVLNEKFQYKNYLAGKNLDQKGNILDAEGWNVTTPIAVVGGTALTFECGGQNTSALCEYDADGNFLDYWSQNAHPRTFTTKANTAYVRLAVPNNPTQDYFVAQNDVVLFNKLRKFDIVEQVAENTKEQITVVGDGNIKELRHKAKTIYPKTTFEAVIDENGNNLKDRLNEIASGGGEGALLYNTEQTLTDEQKSQVAKNIGQPRERLILEWSNEDAEVLQPTAYDTESGLFEVETMPSYLAEDGAVKQLQMNYDRSLFLTPDNWKNLPKPQSNESSWFFVKREDFTHISLWQDIKATTLISIPSAVTVEKFYFTQGLCPFIHFPKYEEGQHKYRLVAEHTSYIPSRYNHMSMLGQEVVASDGCTFYELGTGYQSTEVVDGNFEIEIEIDHTTYQYRFVSIKGYCTKRDNNSKLTQLVNRPLFGPWTDFAWQQRPNCIWTVWPWAIKKDTTIKLYEIVE